TTIAQAASDATIKERPMVATDKQIENLSTFLQSNIINRPGEGSMSQSDHQLNDRTAEWLRNRFEEELVAGGNPEAMQRKMNEQLAGRGLEVSYHPNAPSTRPYRMSQLEVRDTKITHHDLLGKPFHPTVGFAYDSGMPLSTWK